MVDPYSPPKAVAPYTGQFGPRRERHIDVSLLDLANALIRHRLVIVGLPLLMAIGTVAIGFDKPRQFVATASFLPRNSASSQGTLAGLAAQFGVSAPSADASQLSQFYDALLESPVILREVVVSRFHYGVDGRIVTRDLIDTYGVEGATMEIRRERAITRLNGAINVRSDPTTGIVRFDVRARYPDLAQQISARMLELVNEYNLRRRQEQAALERAFLESRLEASRKNLHAAEGQLQGFMQRNKQYQSDPVLVLDHDRLVRTVAMRQDVFTSLTQRVEQSAIEAARDTPLISSIESPIVPALPASRGLAVRTLLAGVVGVVVAFLFVLVAAIGQRLRDEDPETFAQFVQLRRDAIRQLMRPWRMRRR